MKKFMTLLFSLAMPVAASAAQQVPTSMIEMAADYAAYQIGRAQILEELADTLTLSPAQRQDLLSYLKQQNLMHTPVPAVIAEGTTLVFEDRQGKAVVDLSLLPVRNGVTINNQFIELSTKKTFAQLINEAQEIIWSQKKATSWIPSFIPEAHAILPAVVGVAKVVAIVAGTYAVGSEFAACTGAEASTLLMCIFRSDAAMIKDNLGAQFAPGRLKSMVCEKGRLKSTSMSYVYKGKEVSNGFRAEHNAKGEMTGLHTYLNDDHECTYVIAKGKVAETKKMASWSTCFDPGTPMKKVNYLFPLHRVISCCKSDKCNQEMQAFISSNTVSAPQPERVHTGPAR